MSGIQNYKKCDKFTSSFRALLNRRLNLTVLLRTVNKRVTLMAKHVVATSEKSVALFIRMAFERPNR